MSVVVKSSIWFIICGFLQRGISIITTPIFTRLLTTEEYGIYNVYNSWLEIITIFATLRLGYGVFVKGLVKYSNDRDNFSSSLLSLATLWCFIVFIIYLLFHNFWNSIFELSTVMMFCMFIMMISTVAFNFWAVMQRNEYRYKALVGLTIITSILKPVSSIVAVLYFKNNKVLARIVALTLTELVVYAGLYIKIIKKGKVKYNKKYWKYALSFNIPLVPHFLSQVILNHSDRIMIKQMVGYNMAGVYSLAYSLAMILTIINTSIMNAMRPWTFQTLKKGEYRRVETVGLCSLSIVGIANVLLIAFAPELVHIFSPSSYNGAIPLIAPITMGVFFAFMYNLFVDIQMNYEKTKSIMIVSMVCAVINIFTNYIFIDKYGYVAAAYTTLFSYMLMAVFHYYAMSYILKKNKISNKIYHISKIIIITILFLIVSIVMALLSEFLFIRLLLMLIILLITYFNLNKIKKYLMPIFNKKKNINY